MPALGRRLYHVLVRKFIKVEFLWNFLFGVSIYVLEDFFPRIFGYSNIIVIYIFSASLAPSLSDEWLAKATGEVVQLLKNKKTKSDMTRTNIQMIGALRFVLKLSLHLVHTYFVLVHLKFRLILFLHTNRIVLHGWEIACWECKTY